MSLQWVGKDCSGFRGQIRPATRLFDLSITTGRARDRTSNPLSIKRAMSKRFQPKTRRLGKSLSPAKATEASSSLLVAPLPPEVSLSSQSSGGSGAGRGCRRRARRTWKTWWLRRSPAAAHSWRRRKRRTWTAPRSLSRRPSPRPPPTAPPSSYPPPGQPPVTNSPPLRRTGLG